MVLVKEMWEEVTGVTLERKFYETFHHASFFPLGRLAKSQMGTDVSLGPGTTEMQSRVTNDP